MNNLDKCAKQTPLFAQVLAYTFPSHGLQFKLSPEHHTLLCSICTLLGVPSFESFEDTNLGSSPGLFGQ